LSVELDLPRDNLVGDDLHERGDDREVVVAGDPENLNLWIHIRLGHEPDRSVPVSGDTSEAILKTSPRTGPSSMMRREINESLRIQDSLPHPVHENQVDIDIYPLGNLESSASDVHQVRVDSYTSQST
jgi:hypothetical protein